MFLIQGFFVQPLQGMLDIAYGDEGIQAVVRKVIFPFMYAGTIFDDGTGAWTGQMMDPQGESTLHDIVINERTVCFKKQYNRHRHLLHAYINYVFDRREGNTWVGTWTHSEVTSDKAWGPSRCVVTEIDEKLFKRDLLDILKSFPAGEFDPAKVRAFAARN